MLERARVRFRTVLQVQENDDREPVTVGEALRQDGFWPAHIKEGGLLRISLER